MKTTRMLGVAVLLSAACGSPDVDETVDDAVTGEEVYSQRLEDGNTFACATCHAVSEPASDGITRPGHPIGDALGRPTYKNGQLTDLRDAVNTCVTEWMAADPLEADDARWLALLDWFTSMSEGDAEPLTFEVVEPPADVSGGDAEAGRSLFNTTCSICHGTDAGDSDKAPPLGGTMLDPAYVARRIRTSGSVSSPTYADLTGGIMPFWAADRLSDPQLLDLVAFVATAEAVATNNGATNNGTTSTTNNTPGELRECDATHAKVGQSLTFSTRFHDVSGNATIVDDCTIEITQFNYDGNGIDVRIYAAEGGDYRNGFPISDDLLNFPVGYENASLTVQLSEGNTLDEVDGLSVWCVDAATSFGDGLFE